MKLLITLSIVLFSFLSFAQPWHGDLWKQQLTVDENNIVYFEEIINVDSVSKTELYFRAREWFFGAFKSSEAVIEVDDSIAGQLLGKGWSNISIKTGDLPAVNFQLWYTIKVYVKSGRYKVVMTDMYFKSYPSKNNINPIKNPVEYTIKTGLYNKKGRPRKLHVAYKEETILTAERLLADLKLEMTDPLDSDDW